MLQWRNLWVMQSSENERMNYLIKLKKVNVYMYIKLNRFEEIKRWIMGWLKLGQNIFKNWKVWIMFDQQRNYWSKDRTFSLSLDSENSVISICLWVPFCLTRHDSWNPPYLNIMLHEKKRLVKWSTLGQNTEHYLGTRNDAFLLFIFFNLKLYPEILRTNKTRDSKDIFITYANPYLKKLLILTLKIK